MQRLVPLVADSSTKTLVVLLPNRSDPTRNVMETGKAQLCVEPSDYAATSLKSEFG